jgi:hypothetical protein
VLSFYKKNTKGHGYMSHSSRTCGGPQVNLGSASIIFTCSSFLKAYPPHLTNLRPSDSDVLTSKQTYLKWWERKENQGRRCDLQYVEDRKGEKGKNHILKTQNENI